jgi:hypothetical protein
LERGELYGRKAKVSVQRLQARSQMRAGERTVASRNSFKMLMATRKVFMSVIFLSCSSAIKAQMAPIIDVFHSFLLSEMH